jgi:hypothetical protein
MWYDWSSDSILIELARHDQIGEQERDPQK